MNRGVGLVLPAPAKVNLFLRIIGRRPDGYHELQTLFQFLDFTDTLTFKVAEHLEIICDVSKLQNNDNLIIKAAQLLQKEGGYSGGAIINLNKKIPIGGGLGGASSNAATTLVGLNLLWDLRLNLNDLADLGLRLGADVPVFVRGSSALARGVGEKLLPMEPKEVWYVLLLPRVNVSTARLYGHSDLPRDSKLLSNLEVLDSSCWYNDFEKLARGLYPMVDKCFALLDNFTDLDLGLGKAMLSGSGACVFASCSTKGVAEKVAGRVSSLGTSAMAVRGVNVSPLWDAVSEYQ